MYFCFQWANAFAVNLMYKKMQLVNSKLSLGWIDKHTMALKTFKDLPQVFFMLMWKGAGNE